jgi:hypothetical protein
MRRSTNWFRRSVAVAVVCGAAGAANAQDATFREALTRVTQMPSDADLQQRVAGFGLNVLNVHWEDTGRSAGSSLGPNISDVTLQVLTDGQVSPWESLLPVVRYPNFTDTTGDIDMDSFMVRVGNHERHGELQTVPLREVLADLNQFLTDPVESDGPLNLLAERDSHVLVSAQHVFLPVPREGEATFVPTIFNYQSAPGNPAVLTLVVTREGMSASIIENRPDDSVGGYGQALFFNAGGERAPFTAERRSDVQARVESGNAQAADATALDPGADVLLFIQIPLVHESVGMLDGLGYGGAMGMAEAEMAPSAAPSAPQARRSDVEQAVLGHGETMGRFAELNGQVIERDDRFPIRVTVQFYRATSNGVVSDADLEAVNAQIQRVYEEADYVGSLVVPEGDRHRPTDWILTNPGGDNWSPRAGTWWFIEG